MHTSVTKAALTVAAALIASVSLSAQGDPNNPTGSTGLLLIDKRGNHVRFFDPATFRELSSFSTGQKAPHEVAISRDHRTAYIPIYGDGVIRDNPNPGNEILIMDLTSRQMTGKIDLSPCQAPHGIQIDGNGMLYVVCDISKTLLVVNPATGRIDATIDVEGTGHWLAVLPSGTKAYVSHQGGGDFISVIDLKARRMLGRVAAPGGSAGIVASPDGTRVFAMVGGRTSPPTVLVIDTAKDMAVDSVRLQGHAQPGYKLRVSLDGKTLITCGFVNGSDSWINILDLSALHAEQRVVKAGRGSMGFAFAPDGRTVLIANDGDGTVTVVDLREGRVSNTFKGGTGIENVTYY